MNLIVTYTTLILHYKFNIQMAVGYTTLLKSWFYMVPKAAAVRTGLMLAHQLV